MLPVAARRSSCDPSPPHLPQMNRIAPRPHRSFVTWRRCVRGAVFRLRTPKGTIGHEQTGQRFAVVVQSDVVALSTWLVAPTSTSALPASFRPVVEVLGRQTRVLAEQTAAVDLQRLGDSVGRLTYEEMRQVDAAL